MHRLSIAASLAVAAALAGASSLPAAAVPGPAPLLCSALPTDPEGQVGAVEVDGDLVADGECRVSGGYVRGDVVVPAGALLDALSLDVHGELRVAGSASLYGAQVHGDVVLDGATGVGLQHTSVVGGITGSAVAVQVYASGVLGDVTVASTGATRLTRSVVGGSVDVRGGRLIVHGTGVRGGLTSTAATDVLVCRASLRGDLTVTDVQGWSRVGQERQELCRTTVGGSVHVVDNPHSVVLDDLVVAGDLLCTGNTGPQTVVRTARLTVAGNRTGQCA